MIGKASSAAASSVMAMLRCAKAKADALSGTEDEESVFGVALLRDIKANFDASTLDYVKSKALIDHLVADPEKPWVEWSRGKPITEKALAALLREYRQQGGRTERGSGEGLPPGRLRGRMGTLPRGRRGRAQTAPRARGGYFAVNPST